MTDARVVSGKWVEGLFHRALRRALNAELVAQLSSQGLRLDQPFAHTYPRERFVHWLEMTASSLYPASARETGLEQLGARVVHELKSGGAIKGPVLAMAKLVGPRRSLKQLVEFIDGHGSLKISLRERSKKDFELELNESDLATFVAGALKPLLETLGARSPRVQTQVVSPTKTVLQLSWA